MSKPTSAAPETAVEAPVETIPAQPSSAPSSAQPTASEPTAKEFKERFPEAEQAIPDAPPAPDGPPTIRLHLCSDGKHRNDEQYEIYKAYEERLELKKQQFKKDRDQFVHIDDIVMGVIQSDRGRGCVFGRYNIEECKAALVTLQIQFFTEMQEFNYKMQARINDEKEKGLVGTDGRPIAKKSGIIT